MIMKKIFFSIFVFLSISSNAQEFYSKGNGIYVCEYKKGFPGAETASRKTYSETRKFIAEYAKEKNVDYEIIDESEIYGGDFTRPTVVIKFKLIYESTKIANGNPAIIKSASYDQNGNQTDVIITTSSAGKNQSDLKKDAIAELRQLKALLDEGILTQSEFNIKSEKLKKIILEN